MNLEKVADYDYKRFWFMLSMFYRRATAENRYDFMKKIFDDKVYSVKVKELLAYYIHRLIQEDTYGKKIKKFPVAEVPSDSTKHRTSNFYSFYEALKYVEYNRELFNETLQFIHKHSTYAQRVLFLFTNKVNRLAIPIHKLRDIFIELDMQKYILDKPPLDCPKPSKIKRSDLVLYYPMLVLPLSGKWIYYYKVGEYEKTNADGDLYDIFHYVGQRYSHISIEGLLKKNILSMYICSNRKHMTESLFKDRHRNDLHNQPHSFVNQYDKIIELTNKLRVFQKDMPSFEIAQGKVVNTVESLLNAVDKGTYTFVNKRHILRNVSVTVERKIIVDFVMGEYLVLEDREFPLEDFIGNKRELSKLVGQYLMIYNIKDKEFGRVE